MNGYNGEERRADSASVRLALLERSYFENKDSLISVHKKLTDFKSETKEDMRIGFHDLKTTIQESAKGCLVCRKEINDEIGKLKAWRNWLSGAWAAGAVLMGAWLSHFYKGRP